MSSLIQELENNEALLMMYLADELPPVDHFEVEQMLANDAGLQRELATIRLATEGAMGMLAVLDADRSAIPAENHAVRQAMRAMKQWQMNRLVRQPVLIVLPRKRIPVWAYPLSGVAALLIGTISWWGFGGQLHTPAPLPSVAVAPSDQVLQGSIPAPAPVPAVTADDQTADRLDSSLESEAPSEDASTNLNDAETQADSLLARSDNSSVASEIFMNEVNP